MDQSNIFILMAGHGLRGLINRRWLHIEWNAFILDINVETSQCVSCVYHLRDKAQSQATVGYCSARYL